MNLTDASLHYQILLVQKRQGRISEEEFTEQAKKIMVTDKNGVLWTLYGDPAQWFRSDGDKWVADWPDYKTQKVRRAFTPEEKKERGKYVLIMVIIGVLVSLVVGMAGWILQYNAENFSEQLSQWAGLTLSFSHFFVQAIIIAGLFVIGALCCWILGLIFIKRKKQGDNPPLMV